MKPRRCRCAVPDCPKEDRVFLSLKDGFSHLGETHGKHVDGRTCEDLLTILDPPRWSGRRGPSRDYVPSREEYERLLDEAQDGLDRVIFNTLGEAGLRENEFLSVRRYWFEDGKLVVPAADPETGFTAKTRRAARTIPFRYMNREAWRIFREWFEEHRKIGVSSTTVWHRVRKAGLRAELRRNLFPHALRARCATYWAYRIPNVTILQDVFGWETPQVAQRYIARSGGQAERAFREWRLENG